MRSRYRRAVLGSGVVLELAEGGRAAGRTALALHGEDGPASMAATIDHLGVEHQVIAPTHPGWVGTERTPELNAVGALARAYLDLLAGDRARDVVVVGASFGAWVGAQMAIDDTQGRIAALVLIGPIGLPPSRRGREPAAGALGAYTGPLAHDPSLSARLGAAGVPALVIRGSEDQITSPVQARAWATALGCDLVVAAGGGHLPCHRAPGATFAAIDSFLSPPLVLSA